VTGLVSPLDRHHYYYEVSLGPKQIPHPSLFSQQSFLLSRFALKTLPVATAPPPPSPQARICNLDKDVEGLPDGNSEALSAEDRDAVVVAPL